MTNLTVTVNGSTQLLVGPDLTPTVQVLQGVGAQGPAGVDGDPGPQGDPGLGLPEGGTTGQVVTKASNTDYDTEWSDPSAEPAWADITGKPSTFPPSTHDHDDRYFTESEVTSSLAGKQPLDSDLTAIAAVTTTAFGRGLLALANAAALRTSAALGTSATLDAPSSGDASTSQVVKGDDTRLTDTRDPEPHLHDDVYYTETEVDTAIDEAMTTEAAARDAAISAAVSAGIATRQPLDSDLTIIAALTTTSYGRAFLALADQAALVALLPSYQPLDSDLTNLAALTTTSYGRSFLELANQAALVALLPSYQPLDADLTSIAAMTTTSYGRAFLELVNQAGLVALLPSYQPLDSDLTLLAALTTTSYGRAVLELANQAALMALLSAASESASGIAEIATQSETDTGTDDARFVTPLKLQTKSKIINAQTGTTYTYVLTDANKWVSFNNGSAVTVTVPPNSGGGSVAFPTGTQIEGAQLGAGQVTFVGGSGVTIRNTPGLKIAAQYGVYGLTKIGTDEWVLYGRISA